MRKSLLALFAVVFFVSMGGFAHALQVGDTVSDVKLEDGLNGKATSLKYFGQKVLCLFYVDPDEEKQNKDLEDDLSAAQLGLEKLVIIGVVNTKDAPWKPDSIIRVMVKKKAEDPKNEGAPILIDDSLQLAKSWNLGGCDDKYVVVIIGADKKVRYIYKGKMSKAERDKAMDIMKKGIAELKAKG